MGLARLGRRTNLGPSPVAKQDADESVIGRGPDHHQLCIDEAIVLDAFVSRGEPVNGTCYVIEDQAELRVRWIIGATLESDLPIVNNLDYDQLLASARERVRDRSW